MGGRYGGTIKGKRRNRGNGASSGQRLNRTKTHRTFTQQLGHMIPNLTPFGRTPTPSLPLETTTQATNAPHTT